MQWEGGRRTGKWGAYCSEEGSVINLVGILRVVVLVVCLSRIVVGGVVGQHLGDQGGGPPAEGGRRGTWAHARCVMRARILTTIDVALRCSL